MAKMKAAIFVEPGRIVLDITTLFPGGKERMRRLMSVIEAKRVDLGAMVTHRHNKLDDIEAAYELFSHQRDSVLKVAILP